MHHVVIIGGSYGGIAALRKLQRDPHIRITLIDRHPYHYLQTEGYELIAGDTYFDNTIVNLSSLCANYENVTFRHTALKAIDPINKTLQLDEGTETYDSLIIALGCVTKRFECDTQVYNYSSGAKSFRGALRLNRFFQDELYKRLESAKHAQENFNIVIGGAGLSGVEIAASMQHFFNHYYRSNTLSCETLKIHLIASREHVLHGMHPKIIEITTKRLAALRVNVHTQCRIASIENHEVVMTNGERIAFDFMIFAGGTAINPALETFEARKNKKGQILVDAYMRSTDHDDVYVIGDAAELKDKKGNILPPTAMTAIGSGTVAAENIIRQREDKPLKKADLRIEGIAIALGGRYAAIDMKFIRFSGYPAYLTKKMIEKFYKWPLWWLAHKGFKKIESCQI
ncbi:NAD(P)/FAD-dependent oxidoreductase [Sulfurovum riftiae]|uniref:FAD/NAD(P)-binding domain-containing protein n=1 Tax=Sulfurovum riftiae TaxID=1630136 RepID=A0A151CJA0_9BACT|nr:FAD-dependent oxidoreductase [Sulfurovum riftiae]KYJ87612.1 hypothetical protein AS592_10955 [Sulfurovum riftiae]